MIRTILEAKALALWALPVKLRDRVAGEWFAAFDACVAIPACNAGASPTTLEGYLALMIAGVALAVVGMTVALVRGRAEPRRAMILWL